MKRSQITNNGFVRFAIIIIGLTLSLAASSAIAQNQAQPNTAITIPASDSDTPENIAAGKIEAELTEGNIEKPPAKTTSTDAPNIEDKAIDQSKNTSQQTSDSSGNQTLDIPSNLTSTWMALALVLAVIIIAAWVLKRAWPGGGNRLFGTLPVLQILGRTNLSQKQTLALIKLDNKIMLLGLTEQNINPLMSIDDPDEISSILDQLESSKSAGIKTGFKNLFSRENQSFDDDITPPAHLYDDSSDKNAENGVLELKTELNRLLQKVRKFKGD